MRNTEHPAPLIAVLFWGAIFWTIIGSGLAWKIDFHKHTAKAVFITCITFSLIFFVRDLIRPKEDKPIDYREQGDQRDEH